MAHDVAKRCMVRRMGPQCVFTGLVGVDPMHFYPAGDFPSLADCEWNLFNGVRRLHSTPDAACFDWAINSDNVRVVRSIAERHWMLLHLTLDDIRPKIIVSLNSLQYVCEQEKIEWHEPKEPEDLNELLLGLKTRRQRQHGVEPVGVREMETIQADL